MVLGLGLWCLKWEWGVVCGAQIGNWAGFVVPKAALGQGLWGLNWHWRRVCGA